MIIENICFLPLKTRKNNTMLYFFGWQYQPTKCSFVSDLSRDDMRHSCLLIGCEEQSQGNCNSTALLLKRTALIHHIRVIFSFFYQVARVLAHRKHYFNPRLFRLLTPNLKSHQIMVNVYMYIYSFWSSRAPHNSSLLILFYVDFGGPRKDKTTIITVKRQ